MEWWDDDLEKMRSLTSFDKVTSIVIILTAESVTKSHKKIQQRRCSSAVPANSVRGSGDIASIIVRSRKLREERI